MSGQTKRKVLYFAYGSNMDPERMEKRIGEFYSIEGAILRGYRLAFNKKAQGKPGEGYANIVRDDSRAVEGVLYEIDEEKLKKLDKFEGVPYHYRRCEITVECKDDRGKMRTCKAIAYIANENMVDKGDRLKPTREYLGHLLKGKGFLSKEYVEMLEKVETLD
ncbi:MAG: gamma-glutamylcyclotransferase [Candidatus Methanomethyliaceae archaeon]|nr:gamma-glutamylcyclotransferase [Candidatus Methanomethyliaceae archaeon]